MSIAELTQDLRNRIKQAIKQQNWFKVAALYKVLDITIELSDEEIVDYNFEDLLNECMTTE